MQDVKRAQDLIGSALYDAKGNKIGRIGNVYVDDSTRQPEWVTVRTGIFGAKESFVPLRGAHTDEHGVNVPVTKDKVRDAPRVNATQGHLSDAEGQNLYQYYGVGRNARTEQAPTEQARTEQARAEPAATGSAETMGDTQAAAPSRAETTAEQQRAAARQRPARQEQPEQPGQPSTETSAPRALTRSEERLRVNTENVESGRVRLRKYVVTEQETITVPISHEEIRIEREPIGEGERHTLSPGQIGETEHEIVLHEQRPVVTTESVPVERVRVSTETVTEETTVQGDVRRERFDIDDKTGRHHRE